MSYYKDLCSILQLFVFFVYNNIYLVFLLNFFVVRKVYTALGDSGFTSDFSGKRILKNDKLITSNGKRILYNEISDAARKIKSIFAVLGVNDQTCTNLFNEIALAVPNFVDCKNYDSTICFDQIN